MLGGFWYRFLYAVLRVVLFFWHPVFRVIGKENIPKSGAYLICPNHRGMFDPVWVILAMNPGHVPRIMAKKEIFCVPVLNRLVTWLGAFAVDREGADIHAIKTGLRCLKDGQQLMIFPEGTRVKPGSTVEPKRGALVLAHRTGAPVLPVYISVNRKLFSPLICVIGKPYVLDFDGKRPTDGQLQAAAQDLMDRIYKMGEGR